MSSFASTPGMLLVLQVVLLVAFLAVTGALMALSVANRLRVRPIRFSWYGGKPFLFWPGGFLFVVLVLTVYAAFEQDYKLMIMGAGYTLGALCWCLAIRMSRAVLVTDQLLIRHHHDAEDTLHWGDVEDYFVSPAGRGQQYVFFFRDAMGQRSRFELPVPRAYEGRFRRLVSRLVENRHILATEEAIG